MAGQHTREFRKDLFVVDGSVVFYGFPLPTRMFIIRLEGSQLLVYSPTHLDDGLQACVDKLGQVAFIVAPNKIHNTFVVEWQKAYPEAKAFAAPGLPERCPNIAWDGVLGEVPSSQLPFSKEITTLVTQGNAFLQEVVLWHRASKTCIVADVVENMTEDWVRRTPGSATWWGRCALSAVNCCFRGLVGRSGPSPEFQMYMSSDPSEIRSTINTVMTWDFDALLLCHGDLVEQDAKVVLLRTLAELMSISQRRPRCLASVCSWLSRWQ